VRHSAKGDKPSLEPRGKEKESWRREYPARTFGEIESQLRALLDVH